MNISTFSWHYRFMEFMQVVPFYRVNLCSYVRGFVWAVLKALCVVFTVLFLVGAVGYIFLFAMLYALFAWPLGLDTTTPEFFFGSAWWCVACISGLWYVVGNALDRRTPKPPSVFVQYVKDRHNKVCRLINFV